MRSRVTWSEQTATVNGSGEAVYTYSATAANTNLAAAVKNISRRITTNAGLSQPMGEETFEVRLRYRAGVNIGDRVSFKGKTLVIRGIENVGELDHELILTCEVADV